MKFRKQLIVKSSRALHNAKMIDFDELSGTLDYTEVGRIASHFYIKRATIELFNANIKTCRLDEEILHWSQKQTSSNEVKVMSGIHAVSR